MAFDSNTLLAALAALGALVLIAIGCVIRLEWRLNKALRGKKAETLEDSIASIERDIKALKQFKGQMTAYLSGVEKRIAKTVQGIGTVRFNAFKGDGTGGNQSFAAGFITEKNDGLILSSLYSRDRVSVFAKPIKDGKSEYELTEEERDALKLAREKARA